MAERLSPELVGARLLALRAAYVPESLVEARARLDRERPRPTLPFEVRAARALAELRALLESHAPSPARPGSLSERRARPLAVLASLGYRAGPAVGGSPRRAIARARFARAACSSRSWNSALPYSRGRASMRSRNVRRPAR